jgi:hypothetical protein
MKKGILGLIVALLLAYSSYGQKPAVVTNNEPGWKKIGETTASFKMQNESISVLGADEFTAIRIKVVDAPLTIERLQVFYESGEMEEIDLSNEIAANADSRVINLKHPDRDVAKVAFTYKTAANADGEKAEVELYGLKTNQPAGSDAYRDDAEKAEHEAEESVEEVKKETSETAREMEREADEAEDEVDAKTEETESDVERAAEKTADGISEGVNDAAAAIKDEKVKDKVAPGGETAYIDDDGKYYYINNEGKKVYITKLQLKDKIDNK